MRPGLSLIFNLLPPGGLVGQVTRRVSGTGRGNGGIHGQLHLTDVADNRPVARVLQLIGLAEIRSHDFDRRSEPDLSVCKYVDAQAATVNEWPQQSRSAEAVEVHARLAQSTTLADHLADAEGAADQSVDVHAAGEDIASCAVEVQGVTGGGELVKDLCGDKVRSLPGRRSARHRGPSRSVSRASASQPPR
jgi:hypothetical protein